VNSLGTPEVHFGYLLGSSLTSIVTSTVTTLLRHGDNTRFSAAHADRATLRALGSKHRGFIEESRRDGLGVGDSSGFSLLELIIVIGIMMVVAAIAAEFVQRAAQTMRLKESAINYSNLLQQARLRAVHDDKYYTVLTATGGTNGPIAFIDVAGTGAYVPGEPMMVFSAGVSPMTFSSGPALSDLESKFLPNDPGAVLTVNTTALGPSFGPRGLPCTPTTGGATTCPYLTPAGVPTSYITFVQNTQNQNWEAVTVTPAGRIRQWRYDGSTWSSLN
jgi:type II secretory pathway pseudopilin PulG